MHRTASQRSVCAYAMHSLAVPSTNCLQKPMLDGTCPTAFGLHSAKTTIDCRARRAVFNPV